MKIIKPILKILLYLVGIITFVFVIFAAYLFIQINRSDGQIITPEGTRKYLVRVPQSYDPAIPTPLVISIHGFAEWPAHQMKISHWNELAERNGCDLQPIGIFSNGEVGGIEYSNCDANATVAFFYNLRWWTFMARW